MHLNYDKETQTLKISPLYFQSVAMVATAVATQGGEAGRGYIQAEPYLLP